MNSVGLRSSGWKKLLYLRQPYPDNYTDESFLSQLKRNETVTKVPYRKLVKDFSQIVFHVNHLVVVILLFTGIYHYKWDPMHLTMATSILSVVGYVVWTFNGRQNTHHTHQNNTQINFNSVKLFILIMFVLSILSPVLKSLTRSTSSDSIWSISALLTFSNIIFHDYAMMPTRFYRPVVSTNMALSNALVLASRLSSTYEVFCFILLSIQFNILIPLFDFSLRKHFRTTAWHWLLFGLMLFSGYYLCYRWADIRITMVWLLAHITILFILPAYFIFLQRYKNELLGPWDIARPVIRSG